MRHAGLRMSGRMLGYSARLDWVTIASSATALSFLRRLGSSSAKIFLTGTWAVELTRPSKSPEPTGRR